MTWTLIKKEVLSQILSLRFTVSLVLALLFLISSTYMLAIDSSWSRRQLFTGYKLQEHFYTNKFSWYWVTRDLPPLRVFATGLDENLTLSANAEAFNYPRFSNNRHFVHNPNRYLFTQFDFVFFFSIVGSLMAFAFTYDAISGERQRGTLRLMMSNPISRALILLTKFLGSYLSFVISLIPALLGVILLLYLQPDLNFSSSDWRATTILFLLAMLYLCPVFMLGLFVSCVTKDPKTTLTALVTLWVILVLSIPNFSPFLAAKLHPIPSVYEIGARIVSLEEEVDRQTDEELNNFVDQHGEDWSDLNDSARKTLDAIWNKYRHKIMRVSVGEPMKIRESFINAAEAQAEISQRLSIISPSAAFVFLASDVARTGIQSEHAFRRAVFRYFREYAEHVEQYLKETNDYGIFMHMQRADPPEFIPPKIHTPQVLATHLPYFMFIMIYSFFLFFAAQIAFIRAQI